jgi:hypothetical protein
MHAFFVTDTQLGLPTKNFYWGAGVEPHGVGVTFTYKQRLPGLSNEKGYIVFFSFYIRMADTIRRKAVAYPEKITFKTAFGMNMVGQGRCK